MKQILILTTKHCRRRLPLTTLLAPLLLLLLITACASTGTYPNYRPRDVSACFYDFTEVYTKRIYHVLTRAPGVSNVKRLWNECEDSGECLCYELLYRGPMEELESWLRSELPTSKAVPFRLVAKGNNRLEVYFDGGFK